MIYIGDAVVDCFLSFSCTLFHSMILSSRWTELPWSTLFWGYFFASSTSVKLNWMQRCLVGWQSTAYLVDGPWYIFPKYIPSHNTTYILMRVMCRFIPQFLQSLEPCPKAKLNRQKRRKRGAQNASFTNFKLNYMSINCQTPSTVLNLEEVWETRLYSNKGLTVFIRIETVKVFKESRFSRYWVDTNYSARKEKSKL